MVAVQYTFTHKQYTEQHNETEYPERNIHNNKNTQSKKFLLGPCRDELRYLAPLGSENISAPYFKQCFFRGGGITPRLSQIPRLPVPRQK